MRELKAPLDEKALKELKAGDRVLISGTVFTARDQAHKRMIERMPFDAKGQVVFYAGPTPGKDGLVGSIGPTTSSRMDPFTEPMLRAGIKGFIGKGPRSSEIRELINKHGAVYFIATGGAAALLGERVKKAEMTAYPELGPEAVLKLEVEKFPVIVAYDRNGNDIFERPRA